MNYTLDGLLASCSDENKNNDSFDDATRQDTDGTGTEGKRHNMDLIMSPHTTFSSWSDNVGYGHRHVQ